MAIVDNTCINCKHYKYQDGYEVDLAGRKFRFRPEHLCTLNPKWEEVSKKHYCSHFNHAPGYYIHKYTPLSERT